MAAILIVDDSITTVVATQKLIKEVFPKHRVLMASTADEALKVVESSATEIVLALIDLHMEGINGIQLMLKLKKKIPLKDVVIVTGDDTPEIKKEIVARGARMLLKPLTKEGLLSVAPQS